MCSMCGGQTPQRKANLQVAKKLIDAYVRKTAEEQLEQTGRHV